MAKKINVGLILELRDARMSRNGITSTRYMSGHSVGDAFHIVSEKGITYRDVWFLDENKVYRMLHPDKHAVDDLYKDPDYEYVHQELGKIGVTLELLWQEHKDKCLEGDSIPMGYAKFYEGYGSHVTVNKLTDHLEDKLGVKTKVD